MRVILAVAVILFALGSSARASDLDRALHKEQDWTAWGGRLGVDWNRNLLGGYGIKVGVPIDTMRTADPRPHQWFAVRQAGGLSFHVENDALRYFSDGSLRIAGGYVLTLPDASRIDLRNFTLRLDPDNNKRLLLHGADGEVWFYIDKLMFELVNDKAQLAIKAADLRIAPALARRIGHAEIANYHVADIVVDSEVTIRGSNKTTLRVCTPYPWPGVEVPEVAGAAYQADLFMSSITPQYLGCLGCTTTSNDGQVKFAPSSTLKNNVNDGSAQATIQGDPLGTSSALYTANVTWNTMFSGDSAPYNNDQHPFLIWNLYRVDPDGRIVQIGRSGVKHAWLTVNGSCLDSCYDSHSLGRGCTDTYGTGNNDADRDLGPRSEIIPAAGLWGRCGSQWDPNCDGNGSRTNNGNGNWDDRMLVRESLMGPDNYPGSSYLFESWYLAREDINIYNSMATVDVNVLKSGSNWVMNGASNYGLGAAINRWVDPANPGANASNSEVSVKEGHARVAVKVTDLGNGQWRYDYAAMNFDFARAVTQNTQPGNTDFLQVLSNKGFDRLVVPLPEGVTVSDIWFADGDSDSGNDWVAQVSTSSISFDAPTGNTLDWGSLYSFSVTVDVAPEEATVSLEVAEAGDPAGLTFPALVPGALAPNDIIFADGFEGVSTP